MREHAAERARRARTHVALLLPLITAVVVAYSHRAELFGAELPATRNDPQIDLEEFVNGEIIVRVRATPVRSEDGSALADEVLAALDEVHTAQQVG